MLLHSTSYPRTAAYKGASLHLAILLLLILLSETGRNRNPTPNPVLLLEQQYYLSKSACCISHSGLLHNDKVYLPNQLLFMLTDYFCITSLDPAEHLLVGKSTSNWHKETELVVFEMIFRLAKHC